MRSRVPTIFAWMHHDLQRSRTFGCLVGLAVCGLAAPPSSDAQCSAAAGNVTAEVVALDQPFFYNRLGANNPAGMIFALKRDVVNRNTGVACDKGSCFAGQVQLRPDKRPRPIALRVNECETLTVVFTNLLAPSPVNDNQPATRTASVHVIGMQLVGSIASDGSNVGNNGSSLAGPNESRTYALLPEREGAYLLYSTAATTGGEGDGGSLAAGLFGILNVEPRSSEWYRSQVTRAELALATTGTTSDGHPIINYDAVYPTTHPHAGLPILRMTQNGRVVHSDLNAIITGPGRGPLAKTYPVNPAYPNRQQPFREFSTVFHDEIIAKQAFPQVFEDEVLGHTFHSARDGFAINYGTAGIGAEILANRFGVGPMARCTECKYEEYFLSSWSVGDPALLVDVPANASNPAAGFVATKAFFPDDPSNVHPSYLNDHVKFRNVHAGPKEHHIFHLHAHQWEHTPDSDNSTYLDSQAIGPGSGFTYDIANGGGGNRNKTVGDAIFHCHFYPHFSQGMWELWRVHDVFESGTVLDAAGRPASGSRALPDGEIAAGTPIPAVVPIPGLPMAPMPGAQVAIVNGQVQVTGTGNPGYPFFVPGLAGHRPPRPPLDTEKDGGLPRHVVMDGGTALHHEERSPNFSLPRARLDMDKFLAAANARRLPEDGTPVEKAAIAFHGRRLHSTVKPDGSPAQFRVNGLPAGPQRGAPFADPCVSDDGTSPVGVPRTYRATAFQLDLIFNKVGWHFPQSRIVALDEDVAPTLAGTRPPEPLFFRAHSGDCITFFHTNRVPNVYKLDDFQVRTPTDILGQHIHLVKFDVTSSDGAANGFNYEDGTFSPDEVHERIDAINALGGLLPFTGTTRTPLTVANGGVQTTIQRWYADPVRNNAGQDRTLRTVFTHDHFGPSTHQQAGQYASLVIEPAGSAWRDPETGTFLGGRADGGPTSWRADILTANAADSYREFMFQLADFQLAYEAGGGGTAAAPVPDPARVINPPAKKEVGLPFLVAKPDVCPGGAPLPCPEAVSADDVGTMSTNYRNEPIALRVRDPATNAQAGGLAGDLAHVFRSNVTRADPFLNTLGPFAPRPGVEPGDPFTPLLRTYENDRVHIRVNVGAQEEGHNMSIHGVKWLFEPSDQNSGFKNSQFMGISEFFEFHVPALSAVKGSLGFEDYLYRAGASTDDLWNGMWGILRAYDGSAGIRGDLLTLPNNPTGKAPPQDAKQFVGVCPKTAPVRRFAVVATTAQQVLPEGTLVYNPDTANGGRLHDPTAIIYFRDSDLDPTLKPGVPIEPLILRARAGECIELALENRLPAAPPDLDGFNTLPMLVENFNNNQIRPSAHVGLHPQLLTYDVSRSDGANVGFNPVQTAAPGGFVDYKWYAGDIRLNPNNTWTATPVEFGAINLISADPIKHASKGAIGALIIEPAGSTWTEDVSSRASATVTRSNRSKFRDFALLFQDDVNLRNDNGAVPNTANAEDSEDSGQKAFNYRTEPLWKRLGFAPNTPLEQTRTFDFTNALVGTPHTPVFTAQAGAEALFRVLAPGGHQRNHVFNLHGHVWLEEPYVNGSTSIGFNPLSEWTGAQMGHAAGNHINIPLMNGAGGKNRIVGDFLYRDFTSFQFDGGLWGLLRVQP